MKEQITRWLNFFQLKKLHGYSQIFNYPYQIFLLWHDRTIRGNQTIHKKLLYEWWHHRLEIQLSSIISVCVCVGFSFPFPSPKTPLEFFHNFFPFLFTFSDFLVFLYSIYRMTKLWTLKQVMYARKNLTEFFGNHQKNRELFNYLQ